MPDKGGLELVLCWHMHQPQYRRSADGVYQQPWVYLHAIKDYADMAAHLEAVPAARAVVNFAPILLDQIADYVTQVETHLRHGTPLRDPVLAGLSEVYPASAADRAALVASYLRANPTRMIDRFPVLRRLSALAAPLREDPRLGGYVSDTYLRDLAVWYHLAWVGETVRRDDARVAALAAQAQGFEASALRGLLALIGEVLAGLVPRYKRLADEGRVELSFTPYAHPIIPLMLDFAVAREAQPDIILPRAHHYPGGLERARWQIHAGQAAFRRHFDREPAGCWPAEGGLSAALLALLDEAGVSWTASGERVLRHSFAAQSRVGDEASVHRAFAVPSSRLRCFFRDDGLSDLIGFSYAHWHADDAVANLLSHLENIARLSAAEEPPLVAIIMDGENAWEYYPENGYYFLRTLYERLADHPVIRLTTFSDYLARHAVPAELPPLVAGSWVNGTFATWIGSPDKNRGWDMLVQAKIDYDRVMATGRLTPEERARAAEALAVCEGSDWCWWFGDYNPRASVMDFEALYRRHLHDLYDILGVTPPAFIDEAFTEQQREEIGRGGAMRAADAV